jgi:magnesium transporter
VTEVLVGLDVAQRERVAALRGQGRFFWLDASVRETRREDLQELLDTAGGALGALSASGDHRGSRAFHVDGASIGFALRCFVGSRAPDGADASELGPLRVHVVVTGEYLLTLHEEQVSLPALLAPDLPSDRGSRYVVYAVLDAMLATTFDALEEVELTLDALAAWTAEDGAPIPGATLRETGSRLATMRRWVTAEQAVFARLGVEVSALRGFDADAEPSFDRLNDQVSRLLASIDAAANGMGMLLDLQLNQRAYVVSVVATVFVPLTFITGFFGMNFGWMVDHIDGPASFWLLGFVVPMATAALAWRFVVRRALIGDAREPERR